jgi:hypothetical protein
LNFGEQFELRRNCDLQFSFAIWLGSLATCSTGEVHAPLPLLSFLSTDLRSGEIINML